jgi:DNA polymerase epsilon subunit 1
MPLERVTNYDEVRADILKQLVDLRDNPVRKEQPFIYHLDVGAMYPNIILTNRLQPSSMVNPAVCAACDFNRPESDCQRRMEWIWRGDYYPADANAIRTISRQMESERVVVKQPDGEETNVLYADLKPAKQAAILKERVKDYSRRIHKRHKDTSEELREDVVCQRENGFYVETVRNIRVRRLSSSSNF